MGPRGIFQNLSIPGTGLYKRSRLVAGEQQTSRAGNRRTTTERWEVVLRLKNDGTLDFISPDNAPLPARAIKVAREQHAHQIKRFLEQQASRINEAREAVLNLHGTVPPPERRFRPMQQRFTEPLPTEPPEPSLSFWDRIWPSRRRSRLEAYERAMEQYRMQVAEWQVRKNRTLSENSLLDDWLERAESGQPDAMTRILELALGRLSWPRETNVSFDIDPGGRLVEMDVDLPEIEDMPNEEAEVAPTGTRLFIRAVSDARRRRDYAGHIHAVGLRVLGEVFAALPTAEEIRISAYTQRSNPSTGERFDEYLYSAKVTRSVWLGIDFTRLADLDPVASFERFELRRTMDRRGNLRAIEPFPPSASADG